MNLAKIKEDVEIASIDYSDRYKVKISYHQFVHWIVKDRFTKQYRVEPLSYERVSSLPKAARKYREAISVTIDIYDVEQSIRLEVANTIVDKLNIENDYLYYLKPYYKEWTKLIRINYILTDGEILAVPKRTK